MHDWKLPLVCSLTLVLPTLSDRLFEATRSWTALKGVELLLLQYFVFYSCVFLPFCTFAHTYFIIGLWAVEQASKQVQNLTGLSFANPLH
jgi:hypothetical protein